MSAPCTPSRKWLYSAADYCRVVFCVSLLLCCAGLCVCAIMR